MGEGFAAFMENPYYRGLYENAPTDRLKRYYELSWERAYRIEELDGNDEGDALCKRLGDKIDALHLQREDVEYMASHAQGGPLKAMYRKWLSKFDA